MKLFYSLKRKVLAVCLGGMILMALCMGGISTWTISNLTHDYELQNMNHIVDKKSAEINDDLLRAESIANYAANSVKRNISDARQLRDPAFRKEMATLVDHDFQDAIPSMNMICSYYLYYPTENVSTLWQANLDDNGSFSDVRAILDRAGKSSTPRHVRAFAYMTDQGDAAWIAPSYSEVLQRYIISYMYPVYKDGIMVAIIGIDLDFDSFMHSVYGEVPPAGDHGRLILSDPSGQMEFSVDQPMGRRLDDMGIFLQNTEEDVRAAGKTDAKMVSYRWEGEDSIASVTSLRNGMNLMDLRSVNQIYARTHRAVMQMGLGLVIVCLVVSLLPLYMISRLSKRLQRVISAANLVGAGKYDVNIQDNHPDDIGELSRNFQSMVEKVAASQQNLEYASRHDPLTGILNRMGLDHEIQDWLRLHPDEPGALISIDLDAFKFINDLHGHLAGDEALRTLARDLRQCFGRKNIIGRNGGDEFAVFMVNASPAEVLEKVKAFSQQPKYFCYDGETHDFSVSIGYTLYTGRNMTLSRLFHQADTALYAVKLQGRNHYRIYEETMEKLNRTSLGFNLETIASNLPTGLLVCEAKNLGRILFVNKTMLELFECRNVNEFMQYTQGIQENIICADDRERVRNFVQQQMENDPDARVKSVIYHIRTVKGHIKKVSSLWRLADNPNYGRVYYASIAEWNIRQYDLDTEVHKTK